MRDKLERTTEMKLDDVKLQSTPWPLTNHLL